MMRRQKQDALTKPAQPSAGMQRSTNELLDDVEYVPYDIVRNEKTGTVVISDVDNLDNTVYNVVRCHTFNIFIVSQNVTGLTVTFNHRNNQNAAPPHQPTSNQISTKNS